MQERHADPLDEAAELVNAMTDSAIAAARRANAPETHPDFDGECCVACGNDIPADRLAMGRIRCVLCQSALEHRQKQTGRPTNWLGGWDSSDA